MSSGMPSGRHAMSRTIFDFLAELRDDNGFAVVPVDDGGGMGGG